MTRPDRRTPVLARGSDSQKREDGLTDKQTEGTSRERGGLLSGKSTDEETVGVRERTVFLCEVTVIVIVVYVFSNEDTRRSFLDTRNRSVRFRSWGKPSDSRKIMTGRVCRPLF